MLRKLLMVGLAALALAAPAAAETGIYTMGATIGQRLLVEPDVTILYIGYDRQNNLATFSMKTQVCALNLPPDNLSFDLTVGQTKTFMVKTECVEGCRSYALSLTFEHWGLESKESEIFLGEVITLIPAPIN